MCPHTNVCVLILNVSSHKCTCPHTQKLWPTFQPEFLREHYICVYTNVYTNVCVLILYTYKCMCPHTICVLIQVYVSSYTETLARIPTRVFARVLRVSASKSTFRILGLRFCECTERIRGLRGGGWEGWGARETYADVCWRMLTYADVCWGDREFLRARFLGFRVCEFLRARFRVEVLTGPWHRQIFESLKLDILVPSYISASSWCWFPSRRLRTAIDVSSRTVCVLILLYMCPHTPVCVLILLCMCPHTTVCVLTDIHVSSYNCMCPHTAKHVSSYNCICPHTTI